MAGLADPHLSAKLLSPAHGDVLYVKASPRPPGARLPVPPIELREGYGEDEDVYLESGRQHSETMFALLARAGVQVSDLRRMLDFGCAAGRMLRWAPESLAERWGCDIKGDTIAWSQRHLSPPLRFVTTTTFPHLPFEDCYFDLVIAGSVFTHIIDLPDAWFLELVRILQPGGYGYATIFDKHALSLVLEPRAGGPRVDGWFAQQLRAFDSRTGAFSTDFSYFSVDEGPDWGGMPVPQVCYDIDYLTARWREVVDIVSVSPEAYGYQTGVVFRKR
jgi:SAM-dependent methyltransferase